MTLNENYCIIALLFFLKEWKLLLTEKPPLLKLQGEKIKTVLYSKIKTVLYRKIKTVQYRKIKAVLNRKIVFFSTILNNCSLLIVLKLKEIEQVQLRK